MVCLFRQQQTESRFNRFKQCWCELCCEKSKMSNPQGADDQNNKNKKTNVSARKGSNKNKNSQQNKKSQTKPPLSITGPSGRVGFKPVTTIQNRPFPRGKGSKKQSGSKKSLNPPSVNKPTGVITITKTGVISSPAGSTQPPNKPPSLDEEIMKWEPKKEDLDDENLIKQSLAEYERKLRESRKNMRSFFEVDEALACLLYEATQKVIQAEYLISTVNPYSTTWEALEKIYSLLSEAKTQIESMNLMEQKRLAKSRFRTSKKINRLLGTLNKCVWEFMLNEAKRLDCVNHHDPTEYITFETRVKQYSSNAPGLPFAFLKKIYTNMMTEANKNTIQGTQ